MPNHQLRFPIPVVAVALGAVMLPLAAFAQDVPSYARPVVISTDETIHGRIASVDGAFNISVNDDRGFIDSVVLHQGTIINPTGLSLSPGMTVTIAGYNAGSAFDANEIDTPYSYSGVLPTPVYYGPGYWCPGFAYGYGPSFSLVFIIGGGYFEHRHFYGRPWDGHGYFGSYIGRPDGRGYDGHGYDGHGYAGHGYDGHGYAGRGYDGHGYAAGRQPLHAGAGELRATPAELHAVPSHAPSAFAGRSFAGSAYAGTPGERTGAVYSGQAVVPGRRTFAQPELRGGAGASTRQFGSQPRSWAAPAMPVSGPALGGRGGGSSVRGGGLAPSSAVHAGPSSGGGSARGSGGAVSHGGGIRH